MVQKTTRPSDNMGIVGVIEPVSQAAATATTGWIDMSSTHTLMAIISAGNLGGTLDAKLEQATDSGGSDAKDVTGKAITQASASDDDTQYIIEACGEDMDAENDFTHMRLSVTTAGTGNLIAGIVLGETQYKPASDYDLESVDEIVGLG